MTRMSHIAHELQGLLIPGHSPEEAHTFMVNNSRASLYIVVVEGAKLLFLAQRHAKNLPPSPVTQGMKTHTLSVRWLNHSKENYAFYIKYLKLCKDSIYGTGFRIRPLGDESIESALEAHQVTLNVLKRVFESKDSPESTPGIPDCIPSRDFCPPPHIEDMIAEERWTHCFAESHKRLVLHLQHNGLNISSSFAEKLRQDMTSEPIECLAAACAMPLFTRQQ